MVNAKDLMNIKWSCWQGHGIKRWEEEANLSDTDIEVFVTEVEVQLYLATIKYHMSILNGPHREWWTEQITFHIMNFNLSQVHYCWSEPHSNSRTFFKSSPYQAIMWNTRSEGRCLCVRVLPDSAHTHTDWAFVWFVPEFMRLHLNICSRRLTSPILQGISRRKTRKMWYNSGQLARLISSKSCFWEFLRLWKRYNGETFWEKEVRDRRSPWT